MKRNILILAFLLLFFIAIPISSAAEEVYIGEYDVDHDYSGNHANLYINGYLYGYSSTGEYPEGDVKLKIVGKNYTKEEYQYTYGDYYFNIPINPGKYSYSVTYLGNSIFNPTSYTNTYNIPKKSANLAVNTKLGIKNLIVTTKLSDYDGNPISGTIRTKLGSKTYFTKTNYNGINILKIPASVGKQQLSISFLGSNIYYNKTSIKNFSIFSNTVISSRSTTSFVKYTEKGNYLFKQYVKWAKIYYFNGLIKTGKKYSYIPINIIRTVNFGSASSSQVVKTYPDGYLSVDKYSYLKEIGIYDYITYNNRYLDYFIICYNSGKTKTVECAHYFSDYWTISSIGVSKIKFYFYC